jgi:filamentous hemagglutinin family protein
MKKTAHFTQRSYLQLLFGLSVLSRTLSALANPVGGTVNQGKVTFSSQGSQFTINQSSGSAYINWQSFNIGAGETTTFLQPSSSSVVWNHINDPNASQILGNLNANGYVILQNQNGFFVGGQAVINTHGLLMTTAPIPMPDLSSGGPWDIKSPPPTASIINYGQINTDKGGSVFLISHDIQNHGTISAPEGNIGLYAGQEVLVSDRPDGRGLSARVTLPSGSIDNSGKLIADAGTIALNAQVVNQGGLIEANSVRDVNGTIELVASDSVNLGSSSVITAKGDSQGVSAGGSVTIKSDAGFSDKAGSTIDVAGGAQGGNGGQVEISASRMSSIDSTISGHAAQGFTSGKLFIDPANILLADFGDNAPGSGTVNPGDPPSAGSPDTLTLNVNSLNNLISQNALSQINLQATKNIEVSTLWTLPDSQDPKASLTLRAGNKITIDDASAIDAGKNWTINMFAGPQNPSSRPAAGTAGIYVNGTGYIQTQNGNINLWAANEVIVASGPPDLVLNNGIRTLGGGSINVTTVFGSVNSGSNPLGFEYQLDAPYYTVSTPASLLALTLGGISTAAGGDVTINSGKDVFSFLPVSSSGQYAAADGGSGAFGPEPGNVTITAAGSVYGHYVVANGHGKITAGQDAGGQIASKNLALSLIKGDWDVEAPNGSIYLQEVRNPNGVFNTVGAFGQAGRHLFDYDPEDSVSLTAGNVYLTCQSLPRTSDPVPVLFPPKLSISAVVGGVFLQDTITLFPSASQGLEISSAGDFAGTPNTPFTQPLLVMSDSGRQRWVDVSSFAPRDHGNSPLGVNDTTPVEIDVGGNMNNLTLVTTKATHLSVAGDMINCGFSG